MKKWVYADNAATTRLHPQALEAMMPYLTKQYGNPSSLYSFGQESRQAIEQARRRMAGCLDCQPGEIFFTSGGSEADNWAIKMTAEAGAAQGKRHIISTAFEHHAVLHTLDALRKKGFDITLLPVYENGIVHVQDVQQAIREDTALVSVMFANNEIGTIQPVAQIGSICQKAGVPFHTDAVQAVGHVAVSFSNINADLLSLSAHKFHGPKGVGALLIRRGLRLGNLIDGGAQEFGRRAGTENTAGIVGMAAALQLACEQMEHTAPLIAARRDRLIQLLTQLSHSRLNGDSVQRLPGNINISFEGIEGESLLLMLDMQGISASSGSACTSGSLDPSHVLLSIGLPHEVAHGSLRLSICEETTDEDIDYMAQTIPPVVERLRKMSPLWERIVEGEENK